MTREEAMQRGQRLYGNRFRYRVERGISSPEKRADAQRQYDAVRKQIDALVARARVLEAAARHYRFRVYERLSESRFIPMDMCQGQGDTWEEAFASIAAPVSPVPQEGSPAQPVVQKGAAL